jgi:DNA polymerase-3 subunit epsilon
MLADVGRCSAPCDLRIDVDEYRHQAVEPFRHLATDDPTTIITALTTKMRRLADAQRYEDAAWVRSRLTTLLRAAIRTQRLTALTRLAEVVAARREPNGGWELAVIRHGRLVAAGVSHPREHPRSTLAILMATAETVWPAPGPTPCASAEETERVLDWLERPGVRLVECSDGWAYPAASAARYTALLG